MNNYDDVVTKVSQYVDTERAKATKMNISEYAIQLHYDISNDMCISFYHVLSVSLYTDFSELCTDFSSTFRSIKPYEELSSIKNRNSHYWWLSKTLRETVQLF
eukprot:397883_1